MIQNQKTINNNLPKLTLYLIGLLGIRLSGEAQNFIALSEMNIAVGQQTYSAPVANKSVTGHTLSIGGVPYTSGVGVHSHSVLKIKNHGSGVFTTKVGVNDFKIDYTNETITSLPLTNGKRVFYSITKTKKQFLGVEGSHGKIDEGRVIFKLRYQGQEVYNSGILRQGDPAKEIKLEVDGGILELIVEDGGDGPSGDHAVWADARMGYFEIPPVLVAGDFNGQVPVQSDEIKKKISNLIRALPEIKFPLAQPSYDWLITNKAAKATIYKTESGKDIVLSNGLIARVFRLNPNLATIDYINQMTGESMLRSVSNEGVLTIDGKEYQLGGLSEQPEYAYTLMNWVEELSAIENSFMLQHVEIKDITERLAWKKVRWASATKAPTGKEVVFTLSKDDVLVNVHYELYDGIPTLGKWIEVINKSNIMIQLNTFKLEQLALVEGENLVDVPKYWVKPNIHIESDYAFGAMQQKTSDVTTYWEKDPRYTSQTNYPLSLPCLLEIKLPIGPDVRIDTGEVFTSYRVWETPLDSRDEERSGLFKRKLYRTISPWTTENPIFLHLTSTQPDDIRRAIDQCAETGYEMIILSFGSGLNMEKEDEAYYQEFKDHVTYAKSKGIELGGYSLLSSRWISEEVDVINPKTGKRGGMIFGSSPCLSSDWGYDYFRKIKKFYTKTGMRVFEHDGSYPGNVCASTSHTYHNGLEDSQWKQYVQIQGLYKWMRAEGVYMNVPDFYVNSGSNKTGIGYREVNWSLPRARQLILGRQNMYDGLWNHIPSMTWTFVPLTQYHGGGAAATLEPLKDHIVDYESHMVQNYGFGVQACYRGPRLYDSPETKEMVLKVIAWYKKYRMILNSDIIHLKRPSGKDWDGIIHINPDLKEKGLALLFNPTAEDMVRDIKLPLYYTGLTKTASVRIKEGISQMYNLSRDYKITVKATIPANSYTWVVIE